MDNKDVFSSNNKYAFFRKMIIASLGLFHKRLEYEFVSEKGETVLKTVPFAIENSDKQWVLDNYEKKDLLCDNEYLNGTNDSIPRGVLSPTSFTILSEESLNDNIPVKIEVPTDIGVETKYTRVKYVPIQISFSIKIKCSDINQLFAIEEQMIEKFDDIMQAYLEHKGVKPIPVQVQKEDGIGVNKKIPLSFSEQKEYVTVDHTFNMISYYPKLNKFSSYKTRINSFDANIDAK